MKGEYAAIATTYGKGRVALFGPHPEERTVLGGHVEEFLGRSKYTLFREDYLYRWVDGEEVDWSYNWWMLRRAVAWAAGVPDSELPPINDAEIFLVKPNVWRPALYVNGRYIMPAPWGNTIIGEMPLEISTNENTTVNFYLDGENLYSDSAPPYVWDFDVPAIGKHRITAEITVDGTTAYAQMDVYIFNLR